MIMTALCYYNDWVEDFDTDFSDVYEGDFLGLW